MKQNRKRKSTIITTNRDTKIQKKSRKVKWKKNKYFLLKFFQNSRIKIEF
jgi:hypothetical protein